MDTFKEQLVKKMPEKNDQIKKLMIVFATCLLAIFCFLFFMGSSLAIFGIVLAGGIIYGGYYLITNLIIEYEYILTNGDLDIDKIVAQRSRKRLATLDLGSAVEFGVADSGLRIGPNETLIKASGNDSRQTDYYIRLNHSSLGNTVLIFTPSEEMLELVRNCLPRNLKYRR